LSRCDAPYARLSNREKQKIFSNHTGRRIALSENVMEISIMVPGIRYAIDLRVVQIRATNSHKQRCRRYHQASANQRSGRCGLILPLVFIFVLYLYSDNDFQSRAAFTGLANRKI